MIEIIFCSLCLLFIYQSLLPTSETETVPAISLENVVQHFLRTAPTETKLALGITEEPNIKRKREELCPVNSVQGTVPDAAVDDPGPGNVCVRLAGSHHEVLLNKRSFASKSAYFRSWWSFEKDKSEEKEEGQEGSGDKPSLAGGDSPGENTR